MITFRRGNHSEELFQQSTKNRTWNTVVTDKQNDWDKPSHGVECSQETREPTPQQPQTNGLWFQRETRRSEWCWWKDPHHTRRVGSRGNRLRPCGLGFTWLRVQNNIKTVLHKHLIDVWPPSNIHHLAAKVLQLAASNCQGGSSENLPVFENKQIWIRQATWNLFWTYWREIRPEIKRRMSESSSLNSGGIFSVDELKTLMAWEWVQGCGVCFVNWIVLRFQFLTLLLCALRTENYERFRDVGIEGLNFHYEHTDGRGKPCPLVTAEYKRVKNNKGDEEKQMIGICCTCKGGIHEPITLPKTQTSFLLC